MIRHGQYEHADSDEAIHARPLIVAQSTWNCADFRLVGVQGRVLTELGRNQATETGQRLRCAPQ